MSSPTPTTEERIRAAQVEEAHEKFTAEYRHSKKEKTIMEEPQEIRIVKDGLFGIEEQMRRVFENMEFARQSVAEAEENADLQEINAELFAWPSLDADPRKMLADEKKIKVKQIVATDKEVKRFRTVLKEAKTKLASAIAEYEAVKAKYGAYRALADLYAAQLKAEVR